jgi:hypothetical protein
MLPMWVIRARGFSSRAEHDAAQRRALEYIRSFSSQN